MSDEWIYEIMGQEFGPVDFATLRQRVAQMKVTPDTPVRNGDGNWILAGHVPGLFQSGPARTANVAPPSAARSAPRPLPPIPATPRSSAPTPQPAAPPRPAPARPQPPSPPAFVPAPASPQASANPPAASPQPVVGPAPVLTQPAAATPTRARTPIELLEFKQLYDIAWLCIFFGYLCLALIAIIALSGACAMVFALRTGWHTPGEVAAATITMYGPVLTPVFFVLVLVSMAFLGAGYLIRLLLQIEMNIRPE